MRNSSGPRAPTRIVFFTHSGHVRARDLGDRRARLQDDVGDETLEVGEEQQVGLVAGRDRAEVVEPVPERSG